MGRFIIVIWWDTASIQKKNDHPLSGAQKNHNPPEYQKFVHKIPKSHAMHLNLTGDFHIYSSKHPRSQDECTAVVLVLENVHNCSFGNGCRMSLEPLRFIRHISIPWQIASHTPRDGFLCIRPTTWNLCWAGCEYCTKKDTTWHVG